MFKKSIKVFRPADPTQKKVIYGQTNNFFFLPNTGRPKIQGYLVCFLYIEAKFSKIIDDISKVN